MQSAEYYGDGDGTVPPGRASYPGVSAEIFAGRSSYSASASPFVPASASNSKPATDFKDGVKEVGEEGVVSAFTFEQLANASPYVPQSHQFAAGATSSNASPDAEKFGAYLSLYQSLLTASGGGAAGASGGAARTAGNTPGINGLTTPGLTPEVTGGSTSEMFTGAGAWPANVLAGLASSLVPGAAAAVDTNAPPVSIREKWTPNDDCDIFRSPSAESDENAEKQMFAGVPETSTGLATNVGADEQLRELFGPVPGPASAFSGTAPGGSSEAHAAAQANINQLLQRLPVGEKKESNVESNEKGQVQVQDFLSSFNSNSNSYKGVVAQSQLN